MKNTYQLIPYISSTQIQQRLKIIAQQIYSDFKNIVTAQNPLKLLGVLKGSFICLSDLVKYLPMDFPVEIYFVQLRSYQGATMTPNQNFQETKLNWEEILSLPTKDRSLTHTTVETFFDQASIIIIEDIIDTGKTLKFLVNDLKKYNIHQLKICSLCSKSAHRQEPIDIDYLGFCVDDVFLVGYGLDFNEQFRHCSELLVYQALEDLSF
jgi:hypoxanthine phosphoribosyltransferase